LPPPDYELDARRLSADDLPFIRKFSCGDAWWEQEVTNFLQASAWEAQQRGDSMTTLFSEPGNPEIIGFMTVADIGLQTKHMKEKLGYADWDDVELSRVPAVHIVYFGVHRDKQSRASGTEILTRLLEGLAAPSVDLLHRPRFIHLNVWKVNSRAVKFYRDNGFKELGERLDESPFFKGKTPILSMVYNRFRKTE